nr:unnamed protein product [Digitaria exilis]
MKPPVTGTRPQSRRPVPSVTTVVISMALLSVLCLTVAADASRASHYHRRHRRHHRHHRAESNIGHISLPPAAAALSPDDAYDGDSPAEPPDAGDAPVPVPRPRRHKPCAPAAFSSAKPPSPAPAMAPTRSHAKPPSPSPRPIIEPPSHAKMPPSLPPAKPPTFSLARPPPRPHAKPPSLSPAWPPSPSPRKASAPMFSPSKPPQLSPSPSHAKAKPTPCTPAKSPQPHPPRLSPIMPPMQPRFSPAIPPAHPPAKPSITPHAQPPVPSTAKPPPLVAPAKPPSPSPTQPPQPSPANNPPPPAASTVPAKPPALPPAISKPIPPPPPPPLAKNSSSACSDVFDVRAFGASGNNASANDTRAFRAAWKAACSSSCCDTATLLVPSDGVFTITSTIFAGPCKSSLTFQIDGVLMPPDGPASWPATDSRKQWIVFYKADGMTLAGKGTIEGNGEEWWNLPCKPHRGPNGSTLPGPCDSPALIRFFLSNDVTVRGLRIENSPQFHLKFDACARVLVDGLFVSSPAFSPNTDGVHVENTTDVQILNSRIYNGDDCVSIGAGCSNVHIENITCGHGHGISIGSLGVHNTRACVSNVTVRNARIIDSDNGLRIKTWQGGAGAVSGVEFAGVQLQNVRSCIVIDQYYCLLGNGCANQSSAVRVAGVAFRDVRGTYNPRGGGAPIRLACSDAVPCTGITMSGVELRPVVGGGGDGGVGARPAEPYCWNAYGVVETLTVPPVYCLLEGRPDSLQDQLTGC